MAPTRAVALGCLAFAALEAPVDAGAFLGSQAHLGAAKRLLTQGAIEQTLFAELGEASGARMHELEEELRPLFTAMPKNEHGNLEPSVTRYALHRYFAQKYGWYVVGLEPGGGSFAAASPGSIMKDRVPAFIESLFQQRLHGEGLGLGEVAIFAATMLDLIHRESIDDLLSVYEHFRLAPSEDLSNHTLDSVMNAYVTLYFHSFDTSSNQTMDLRKMERELRDEFIIWPDVTMWARDLRSTVRSQQVQRNAFASPGSFDRVAEYARELGHHFGGFQDLECKSLKRQLMDLEYRGTGRVRLSEFYGGSHDSSWTFTESVDYLRALGALDEADPSRMSVIIPNFVVSQTNCVTPSNLYSACCLNECESLLSSLERVLGAPMAEPARISALVAALPSDTIEAPRVLPAAQLQRLEEIARVNGGGVPLHGRLFAQWMHHAYPRECPYPHVTGATSPVSPDEWVRLAGTTEASNADMRRHAKGRADEEELALAMSPEAKAEALPWIPVEELVISEAQRAAGFAGAFKIVGFATAAAASLLQARKLWRAALGPLAGKAGKVHLV